MEHGPPLRTAFERRPPLLLPGESDRSLCLFDRFQVNIFMPFCAGRQFCLRESAAAQHDFAGAEKKRQITGK